MRTCSVDGCEAKRHAWGYCAKHYGAARRHGDPLVWMGQRLGRKRLPVPSYGAIHKRLERERGRASQFACTLCGNPAQEWSYAGGAEVEAIDPAAGIAYSPDLSCYRPLCRRCHRSIDHSLDHSIHRNERGQFIPRHMWAGAS